MQIIKRDGTLVEFDKTRIVNAINAAFLEVDGKLYETDTAEDIALDIEKTIKNSPIQVTVESIQDWIEDFLMRSERRDVARAYIRYRYKKEVARNHKDDFMNAIGEKLAAKNV
jgi:anaerobic ribonucleoside-triphosphate reductase